MKKKNIFKKKKENMVNDSFMELFYKVFIFVVFFSNRSFVAEKLFFPIANSKHYEIYIFSSFSWMLLLYVYETIFVHVYSMWVKSGAAVRKKFMFLI